MNPSKQGGNNINTPDENVESGAYGGHYYYEFTKSASKNDKSEIPSADAKRPPKNHPDIQQTPVDEGRKQSNEVIGNEDDKSVFVADNNGTPQEGSIPEDRVQASKFSGNMLPNSSASNQFTDDQQDEFLKMLKSIFENAGYVFNANTQVYERAIATDQYPRFKLPNFINLNPQDQESFFHFVFKLSRTTNLDALRKDSTNQVVDGDRNVWPQYRPFSFSSHLPIGYSESTTMAFGLSVLCDSQDKKSFPKQLAMLI